MSDKSEIHATLDRLYDDLKFGKEKFSTIQNWCLTVWLAALAAVYSPDLALSDAQRVVLPLLAIVVFWLLGAFQVMQIEMVKERASRLETWLYDHVESAAPQMDIRFVAGQETFAHEQPFRKLRLLLRAMLLRETVTIYFGLLLLASVAFQLLGR
jgi:hypothetical protein